jgi:hypothetical protein
MTDKQEVKVSGMSQFFLFAIPAVLGLGAAMWLGVWIDAHHFRHELSQEDRAASYVGAGVRPTDKIKIVIRDESCVHVTRADLDGADLLIYTENHCGRSIAFMEWHWQLLSPDGTVIKGNWYNTGNCAAPISNGDKAECHVDVTDYSGTVDDRASTLRVWTSDAH